MPAADTLLRTKLRLPYTRPELVARPRLQARLLDGLQRPLTLITAPAGFGKTTLAAAALRAQSRPVAWLSLDRDDNQPDHFLRYLIAALQTADAALGRQAAQLHAAAQPAKTEAVLASLLNDLDAAPAEFVLALDDYQFIHRPAVHELVTSLLDHCPTNLHLLIASRSDPPLPLARLRARGQLLELRAADLRFNETEAALFLNEVMGLALSSESVAALEARTEGWIAGLQLAALSMRTHSDIGAFIAGFSGTHRYILDYLLEEVLAGQPEPVQDFLLRTSILDRLSAPLCAAVLGSEASTAGERLHELERANLFLVPLDEQRRWYRYHHLFADLLRSQLQQKLGGGGMAQLHRRAAAWHARHGSILEAIHHASAAGDEQQAEKYIEQHYRQMLTRGEMAAMRTWSAELDPEQIERRPWLCIYDAYSRSWFGELQQADRLLAAAEKHLDGLAGSDESALMRAHLTYVKSRVTAQRGDLPAAIEFCLAARRAIPGDHHVLQLDTLITLGYEYFLLGDFQHALPLLEEVLQASLDSRAIMNLAASACLLARVDLIAGRLPAAFERCRQAAQAVPEDGNQHLGARGLIAAALAELHLERNELPAASTYLQQARELLPMWDKADDLALAGVTRMRLEMAQGDHAAARQALDGARQIVHSRGVFSEARLAVQAAGVRLELACGDLAAASRLLASPPDPQPTAGFEAEPLHLARARLLLARELPNKALAVLGPLEHAAREAGRHGRRIEILLLQARAHNARPDPGAACSALGESLALAQAGGYERVFLDQGQPLRGLLESWLPAAEDPGLRGFAARLLDQWDSPAPETAADRPAARALIEPLTKRELQVLQHIARGLTNQAIADELVIAPGTVKAHTASIYGKLGVNNRTAAAARARELGLIA